MGQRRRVRIGVLFLMAAATGCNLLRGSAPTETPTPPPATATPAAEGGEIPAPPPSGLLDALQSQVDSGALTNEQALVSGLQILAGEVELSSVLPEAPASVEGTGIAFDARRYLQTGTDDAAKGEIQRLLTILAPLPEVLLPYSSREGASLGAGLAKPSAQVDCAALFADGFPPDSPAPCFAYKESAFGPSAIQIFYPVVQQPEGFSLEYAEAAQQAVLDSLRTYSALDLPGAPPVLKDIEVVFSLLDRPNGSTLAMVPSDPGANPCQIILFPLAMEYNEFVQDEVTPTPGGPPPATANFQQTVAHEMFHCFQIWNFPALAQNALWRVQDWWGESTATYFSNVVYPTVNDEWYWVDDWSYNSALTPLVYMSYDNFGFFQFLANRIGDRGVLELIQSLEPAAGGDEDDQAIQLARFPGIESLFEEYALAFMDGTIADTGQGIFPTAPAFVPPPYRIDVFGDAMIPFGAQPFTLTRYGLTFGSAQEYDLSPMLDLPGFAGIRRVNDTGPWTDVPTQVQGSCIPARYYLLMANTTTSASGANFGLTATAGNPLDCGFPTPTATIEIAGTATTGFDLGSCQPGFLEFGFAEVGSDSGYGCVEGGFRAWIENDLHPFDFTSASPGASYSDVVIEVDSRFVEGSEDGGAFLLCRGNQIFGDFYYLRLDRSGSVTIGLYVAGEEQWARFDSLAGGVLQPEGDHLRAECSGPRLSLTVNGVLAIETQDNTHAQGDIGLGAGGAESGRTEVLFSNLAVSQP